MSFDPAADINVANSPEAMADMRAQAEDNAALDAKYSNPGVLEGEQARLMHDLYPKGYVCTPEEKEHNAEQFIQRYAADLEFLLNPELSLEIGKSYEENGDIEAAVFTIVSQMDIPNGGLSISLENIEEAVEAITQYLNPQTTSRILNERLQSPEGITVQSGMNASYINALSGSHRHVDLNPEANNLQVGDKISYGADSTSLLKNDTQIGSLNEDNGDLNVIGGKEYQESRYAPIIDKHTVANDSVTDILHDITGQQVEEIGAHYAGGMDIVAAMGEVLAPDHQALTQAKNLDNPDLIDERRADMYKDLDIPQECRVNESENKEGDAITNLLSENYTRIVGEDGEPDKNASLLMATQISANKIIEGKHTFTRTAEFDEAVLRIQEGTGGQESLATDLTLIYNTVNNAEGIRGKSRHSETQRLRRSAEQKSLFLQTEFDEIQALFIKANESGDTQGIQEQREAVLSLQEDQIALGDAKILGGGDLDLMAQLDDAMSEAA